MLLSTLLQQEATSGPDIAWLVWVVLALFLLMVLLGWWASGRLPKEDETVPMHGTGEDGHETLGKAVVNHEEQ